MSRITSRRSAPEISTGQGILRTADEIGIERFVIEQDMCEGDPFEAVKVSYDNLVKMGIR